MMSTEGAQKRGVGWGGGVRGSEMRGGSHRRESDKWDSSDTWTRTRTIDSKGLRAANYPMPEQIGQVAAPGAGRHRYHDTGSSCAALSAPRFIVAEAQPSILR